MLTCPKCRVLAENDEARFCSECREPLNPAARDADGSEGDDNRVSEVPDTDSGSLPTSSKREDAKEEYVRAVEESLADGVLDEADRSTLDDARRQLNLSEGEAVELESQAKDAVTADISSEAPAPVDGPAVVLEINDGHFYMEDFLGVLDFRLVNQRNLPIEEVTLAVSGKKLGEVAGSQLPLGPCDTLRQYTQIEPEKAGEHVVDIVLRYRLEGVSQTWSAQALFMVLAQHTPIDIIQLTIDQSDTFTGEKIGFGQSIRKEVHAGVLKGLIKDSNDLISQSYPERWQRVSLRRQDMGMTSVRVVRQLGALEPGLDKASLVFHGCDDNDMRTLLLGLAKVRMGRKRQGNDIVLRRFPRSDADDRKTQLINRIHLNIMLRRDGLYLCDLKTMNGTLLEGKPVQGDVKLPLDQPSEVDVGGALRLRVTPFHDADAEGTIKTERYRELGSPDGLWALAERLRLRSLLIERVDNLAREERYVIVYRWAVCGAGVGNEVRIFQGGLEHRHLRIVRLGGQLWVESTVDEDRLVVNGIPVGHGYAFPLTPELVLRFGELEGIVAEFRQVGLR